MIFAKSLFAGVVISLIAWVLSAVVYLCVVIGPKAQVRGHVYAGVDVRVFLQPFFLTIALLAFAIGFYRELRRA